MSLRPFCGRDLPVAIANVAADCRGQSDEYTSLRDLQNTQAYLAGVNSARLTARRGLPALTRCRHTSALSHSCWGEEAEIECFRGRKLHLATLSILWRN